MAFLICPLSLNRSTQSNTISSRLPPPNGYQRRGNIADPPLRGQQVELRRGVPRILHINPYPQPIDIPSRLRRNQTHRRAKSQNQ